MILDGRMIDSPRLVTRQTRNGPLFFHEYPVSFPGMGQVMCTVRVGSAMTPPALAFGDDVQISVTGINTFGQGGFVADAVLVDGVAQAGGASAAAANWS